MRVVIVEDSVDLANAIADVLFEAGHDVATYEGRTLEDVLACLVTDRCDVLLLDLGLNFDGAAVVDALGLVPDRPAIVLCTGADEKRVAPLRDRVHAVLRKPFKCEEIVELLTSIAREREEVPSGIRQPFGSRRRDTA